jgi:class 3 adenylate cyclase
MGTVAPSQPPLPPPSQNAIANKLATPATRLSVLLFTDIVGSTQLKSTLGTAVYTRLLQRHNELFDAGLRECPGAQSIKHTGDGYFASFTTASDAVRFALKFQARMGIEPWDPRPLKTRVGIHIGEVALVDMAGRADVIGLSADVAARIMSLAMGGQILLTMLLPPRQACRLRKGPPRRPPRSRGHPRLAPRHGPGHPRPSRLGPREKAR